MFCCDMQISEGKIN
ncbi:rCG39209, isoform CRA_a [Rattus norvegicus]|uniref:RCG39209, isoform CRA_a n=1 Tax=Rattus norvegicus TaxID=10116 RepID=A6KMG0_RAT|nr:rCG39209, isoform CRA_a [Rattus norvegicus]